MKRMAILTAGLALLTFPGITAAQMPAKPAPTRRIATLNLDQVPLRSALETIFDAAGVQFTVAPNVLNVPVTLKLRDVPWTVALDLVIHQAGIAVPGLGFSKTGDVYVVEIRPKPGDHVPLINLNLKEAPLRSALETIFANTGISYTIAPTVRDMRITVNLRDVSVDDALRAVFHQAREVQPELVMTKTGRGYFIETHPLDGVHRAPELITRLYPLRFRSADEVEKILQSEVSLDGLGSVASTADGKAVVVHASAEGHERAEQLVRVLDVARRSLRLRVGITAVEAGGKVLHYGGSATTMEGQPLTIEESLPLDGRPAHVRVRIEPTPFGDDGFQIMSDWDVSLPLMATGSRPLRLTKKLSSTTVVLPGQPVEIAAADLSAWGIPRRVRFWLSAEALGLRKR